MFLLYQYLEGSPKKLYNDPANIAGECHSIPQIKVPNVKQLKIPAVFVTHHCWVELTVFIFRLSAHFLRSYPNNSWSICPSCVAKSEITATCWATFSFFYFGHTFHFCQEIRGFFRGSPSFAEDQQPDGRPPRRGRTNHPQVITIKVDIFLWVLYMHYKLHQHVGGFIFLFFQHYCSHFLRWGKPFTNKVFSGDEMTWSLGHCEKGHLFVMILLGLSATRQSAGRSLQQQIGDYSTNVQKK